MDCSKWDIYLAFLSQVRAWWFAARMPFLLRQPRGIHCACKPCLGRHRGDMHERCEWASVWGRV